MLRQPQHRLRLDAGARAAGDVVQHQREPGRLGDPQEVRLDGGLRGPAVVRGDDQQAVGARLFRLSAQFHGVPCVGRPDARDQRHVRADRRPHRAYQGRLLGVGGGRRLTGGAAEHQTVAAVGDQRRGVCGRGVGIEAAGGGERRDHGAEGAAEGAGAGACGRRHARSVGPPDREGPLSSSWGEGEAALNYVREADPQRPVGCRGPVTARA